MKHVEDSNKHTIEETVRQVGYLPELYEDARSEKVQNFAFCLLSFVAQFAKRTHDMEVCFFFVPDNGPT